MKMFRQGLFPGMSFAPDERMRGGTYIHQDGDGIDGGGGGGGAVSKDKGDASSGDVDLESTADQLSQGLAGFSQQLQTLQDGLARVRKERDDVLEAKEKLGQKLAREMQIVGSVRQELRETKDRVAELEEQLGQGVERVVDASIWGALNAVLTSVKEINTNLRQVVSPLKPFLEAKILQGYEDIETALDALETSIKDIMSSAYSRTPVHAATTVGQSASEPAETESAKAPAPVEKSDPVEEKPAKRAPAAASSAGEIAATLAGEDVAGEFWFDAQVQDDVVHAAQHWTRRVIASLRVCYGDSWTRLVPLFFRSLRVNNETKMPGASRSNDYATSGLIKNGTMVPTNARDGRRAAHRVIRLSKLAAADRISEQSAELEKAYVYGGWNADPRGEGADLGKRRERFVVDALKDDETIIAVESESMHHSVANLVAVLLQSSNLTDMSTPKPVGTTREQWEEALRFVNRLLMHRDYVAEDHKKSVELHITSKTKPTKRVVDGIYSLFDATGKPDAVRIIWYHDEMSRAEELRRGGGDSSVAPVSRGGSRPHRVARLMDLKHSKGRSTQQEPRRDAKSKKADGRKKRPSEPEIPAVSASPAEPQNVAPDGTVLGYVTAQDVARAAEQARREEPAAVEKPAKVVSAAAPVEKRTVDEPAHINPVAGMTEQQIARLRQQAQAALLGLVNDRRFIDKSESHKAKRDAFVEAVLGGFEKGRSIWQERVEFLPTHSAKVSELLTIYGEWPGSRSKNGSDVRVPETAREEDPPIAKFMTGAEPVATAEPIAIAEPVVEEEPAVVEGSAAVDGQAATGVSPSRTSDEFYGPGADFRVVSEADDVSDVPSAVEVQTVVAEDTALAEPAKPEEPAAVAEPSVAEPAKPEELAAVEESAVTEPAKQEEPATVEEPTLDGTDALTASMGNEPDVAAEPAAVEETAVEEPAPVEPQAGERFQGFDAEAGAVKPSREERPSRKMRAEKVKAKKTRSREFPRIELEQPVEETQDYADLWDEVYQLNILERENHNYAVVDQFVKWAIAKGEYEKLFESDRELHELIVELYQRWVEFGRPSMDTVRASDLLSQEYDDWTLYVMWRRVLRFGPEALHDQDDFYLIERPWDSADFESACRRFEAWMRNPPVGKGQRINWDRRTPGIKIDDIIQTLMARRQSADIADERQEAFSEAIGKFVWLLRVTFKGDKIKEADFIFGDGVGRILHDIILHVEWLQSEALGCFPT